MNDEKKCPSCGNDVEQGQSFCVYCGAKVADESNNDGLNAIPKKRNTGLIIGIVAAIVIAFATIGMLAEKYAHKQDADSYSTNSAEEELKEGLKEVENILSTIDDTSKTKKEYSKGTFTSTSYESEFIGVRFYAPENWVLVSEDELAQLPSDARTTWEMQAISVSEGINVIVAVEKLLTSNMSIDMYIDSLKQNLSSDSGVTISNMQEGGTKMIAGEVYNVFSYNGTQNNMTYTQTFCLRKINEYVAIFTVTSVGTTDLNILNSFVAY